MKTKHIFPLLIFCTSSILFINSCKKGYLGVGGNLISPYLLSPARQIAGTWKTPLAVTFYYVSDYCGSRQRVAKFDMTLTWKIKKTGKNTVDIEWSQDSKTSTQVIIPGCYWVEQPFPIGLTGEISSNHMELFQGGNNIGSMDFTEDLMEGTITNAFWECFLYCSGIENDYKTLHLQRK